LETPPKKLLVVCHGAIGDVTRALPLVCRIKKHWPSTVIHWGVEPISSSIVIGHPAIDKVHVFNRPEGFSAYRDYLRRLKAEKFELVLDLQRHFKSGITSFLTGAKTRIAFNKKNSREGNWLFSTQQVKAMPHYSIKTEQYQNFGDVLGLPRDEKLDFSLKPNEEEKTKIEEIFTEQGFFTENPQPYIALILGSTWQSRFWKAEYYSELINKMYIKFGYTAVLIGSRSEKEFSEQIMKSCEPSTVLNLVEKTSLRDLVGVFSVCSCAVGSDSGPMHIAAGVGIPVISLWGATSPLRSAPYGSEKLVLQSPVGCSPCYKKNCPGLDTLCMADIPVNAVVARLESLSL